MALAVTHTKVDSIPDDPIQAAQGRVLPSHWNSVHTLAGTVDLTQLDQSIVPTWTGQHTFSSSTNLTDFRNGTTVQQIYLYETFTNASNNSRLEFGYGLGGNAAYVIRPTAVGTGTARGLTFEVPATTSFVIRIAGTGNIFQITTTGLLFSTDNTYDFGSSGALRPRIIYVGTRVQAPTIQSTGVAFASLPAAPSAGMMACVTDSNTATWGATIAGGGANNVQARYNGANWTVMGA